MTVTAGEYALGSAGLAIIVLSLGLTAWTLRKRLLPGWAGAPARLAETVTAVALLTLTLTILGTFGALCGWTITVGTALMALATLVAGRGTSRVRSTREVHLTATPQTQPWQLWVGVTVSLLLIAQWSIPSLAALDRGIYGGDSLWYHLPFAAEMASSHSITSLHFVDPLYLNWFYPQNSELLHAAGIALYGNDFLSPLLNLGWLALTLLAAWCVGRPWNNGAVSLTGVAILLAADLMFSRQPGNANNDIVGLALMLAAVALLAEGWSRREQAGPLEGWALVAAGAAAGLALGTKLTFLVPVTVLTVGVVVIAPRGFRWLTALAWSVPLLLTGGFWFARNLVVAGNPLPWQKLGPLPRTEELEGRDPFSVIHYATDTSVWRHYFFPGLEERFGELWPVVLAFATLGVIAVLVRGDRLTRMLAVVVAVTAVAYVLTPLSASGEEGAPLGFRLNLRYLAPALGIGLALLATLPSLIPERRREVASIALTALLGGVLLLGHSPLPAFDDGHQLGALAIAAGAAAAIALALLSRGGRGGGRHRAALVGAGVALAAAFLALGWPLERDYEKHRYALADQPRDQHPGSELAGGLGAVYEFMRGLDEDGVKVALGGTTGAFFQYGFYGPGSANDVDYIGSRGSRGSFDEVPDCIIWRDKINEGGYRFVITTPGYDQDDPDHRIQTRFERWTETDPAATKLLEEPNVTLFAIDGDLDPSRCE